jgi:hypothetical protein
MKRNWNAIANWALGISLAVTTPLIAYMGYKLADQTIRCTKEIVPKHTRKQIEEIVNSVNTPKEAFVKVSMELVITDKADKIAGCDLGLRIMSMQESYAVGHGDCAEGAVAFAATLSDNQEYKVKTYRVWGLVENPDMGHIVAVYKEHNDWGMASFNNLIQSDMASAIVLLRNIYFFKEAMIYYDNRYPDGIYNFITKAKFESIDEAFTEFSTACNDGKKVKYKLLNLTSEELKFGKGL